MQKRWISLLLVLALVLAVWSVCAVAADAQKADEAAGEEAAAEPAAEEPAEEDICGALWLVNIFLPKVEPLHSILMVVTLVFCVVLLISHLCYTLSTFFP